MTLPGVFLVSPDDNQTRQFITKARPGIYRWVLAHYDVFRRTFPQPAGGYYGAHSIQPGHLLHHHIKGDFQTWDSVSRLVSADYLDPNTFYPPYLNSNEFLAFDSYGPGPHKPTRGIANSFLHNEPIDADLVEGGRSNYFLLPSLGWMMVSNIRHNIASVQDLINFFGSNIAGLGGEEGKYGSKRGASIPPLFRTTGVGKDKRYTFIDDIHEIFTNSNRFPNDVANAGLSIADFESRLNNARNQVGSLDYADELEPIKDQPPNKFTSVFKEYLLPLTRLLAVPFPDGQVVALSEQEKNQNRFNSASDDEKDGFWVVERSQRNDKKIQLTLVSSLNSSLRVPNVPLSVVFIPPGEEDLRRNQILSNHPGLPLLELFADCYSYYENYNILMMDGADHSRFSADHMRGIDGTSTALFHRESSEKNPTQPWGKFWADIRADHTVAYFANMYAKMPKMRGQLEKLFTGDNFTFATVQWYIDIISKHMNPVLIPVMAQQGLPGTRQVSQLPAVPTGASISVPMVTQEVDFRLESPLLRDAYLTYSQNFNRWFSQVLIGGNRGYLYGQPYGPDPTGSEKKEKKIKAARASFEQAMREGWSYASASLLSLLNLPEVSAELITRILREETQRVRAGVNESRPSLPPGFDPSGRDSLQGYLDFLQQTYRDDPEMLTAVANAAVRGRLETISDRTMVEELFMNDFKKHLKMKALGTVKYPAFAELIRILRDYISVPEDQLNEFVARQLTDDIRTEIENRAVEERGFTVLPEQPQIVPGAPDIQVVGP